jgi:hypothetical protein
MYIISFTRNTSRNTIKTWRCNKRHRTYTWPKSIAMHQTKMESIELPYARSSVDINMDSYFRPKYRIHFKIVMLRAGFSMFQHNMDARRVLLLWPPAGPRPDLQVNKPLNELVLLQNITGNHVFVCLVVQGGSLQFLSLQHPSTISRIQVTSNEIGKVISYQNSLVNWTCHFLRGYLKDIQLKHHCSCWSNGPWFLRHMAVLWSFVSLAFARQPPSGEMKCGIWIHWFSMVEWLVGGLEDVFPYIGNVIIPTDINWLSYFSEG